MRIEIITKPGSVMTGTGRYVQQLTNGFIADGHGVTVRPPAPFPPDWAARVPKMAGIDLQTFFSSYPLGLETDGDIPDVYHIPTQTMGTLLRFKRFPAPVIATILDIIPYLVRNDPELNVLRHPVDKRFYEMALKSLHKADALTAISEYSKRTAVEALGLDPETIHVVYLAIDHEHFSPREITPDFITKYGLDTNRYHALFVGSEDPRKNLNALVEAAAQVDASALDKPLRVLKVGRAHFNDERQRLTELAAKLNVDLAFYDDIPDDDLPLFYSFADVFVMASRYEGFGYPVLEAMACGTPVICADATSLPEVAGDAALMFDPLKPDELAAHLTHMLASASTRAEHRERGLAHVSNFHWSRTIADTLAVYEKVLSRSKAGAPS